MDILTKPLRNIVQHKMRLIDSEELTNEELRQAVLREDGILYAAQVDLAEDFNDVQTIRDDAAEAIFIDASGRGAIAFGDDVEWYYAVESMKEMIIEWLFDNTERLLEA